MADTSAREARRTESAEPRGGLTVRVSAMPADTNANGDIFGGWVLSRMDQAGGIAGVERARGRVVTIALDAMTFIRPVRVGDVLEVYTEVESIGRTSMKMHIEAWARRFETHTQEKVTLQLRRSMSPASCRASWTALSSGDKPAGICRWMRAAKGSPPFRRS